MRSKARLLRLVDDGREAIIELRVDRILYEFARHLTKDPRGVRPGTRDTAARELEAQLCQVMGELLEMHLKTGAYQIPDEVGGLFNGTPVGPNTCIDLAWSSWADLSHYDIGLEDIVFDDWDWEEYLNDDDAGELYLVHSGNPTSRDATDSRQARPVFTLVPVGET